MSKAEFHSFAKSTRLFSLLAALAVGFAATAVLATDEEPKEMVPGLNLWTHEHEDRPITATESAPDLRSPSARHRAYREQGVPIEYRSRINPYPAAQSVIRSGGRLYGTLCVGCHGAQGQGDGEAGKNLAILPALLSQLVQRPRSIDEYLLWSISEGGDPFDSAMPAFKDVLSEQQIWQIVGYMRAGFPPLEEARSQ